MNDREFLSVKEAGDCIGLSAQTIRRAIKSGDLRAKRMTGISGRGTLRVHRNALNEWFNASRDACDS